MGLLVGAMDIATANNTVAIVMANPIAKEMAQTYDVSAKKTASILDTFSCIFQGVIPYGAQMLVALSVASELGQGVSAFQVLPNLIYPYMLLICSLIFIFLFNGLNSIITLIIVSGLGFISNGIFLFISSIVANFI